MTNEPEPNVTIYTDGACAGNPGPGGWGAILISGSHRRELAGGEATTTNNRMELMGAIAALEQLTRPCRVHITTDSQYVKQGMQQWLPRWQANGWRTADKKPVKNQDLWERLAKAVARHQVEWFWTRGHAGHPDNERVDRAARLAAERQTQDA